MPLITKRQECHDWLVERLADGPVKFEVLSYEAKRYQFSRSTLQRASMSAGIIKRKHLDFPSEYTTWELPHE